MSLPKQIVDKYSSTCAFPHTVTKLTTLINDPNSSIKDFEQIIEVDPILVGRVLELVNSSAFSPIQKVDSIARAITFIGMEGLHNLVITDTMHGIFTKNDHTSVTIFKDSLWRHSVATAITSKMVSERIVGTKGDQSYLCAILHDVGLIIEHAVEPTKFDEICTDCKTSKELVEKELAILGTSHNQIGQYITKKWLMPSDVSMAIRYHHREDAAFTPSSFAGILQISEYLCSLLGYQALPGLTQNIAPHIMEHIEENADEYEVLVQDLPEHLEKVEAVYS